MTSPTPRVIAALLGPAGHQIGCDESAGRDADAATPGMRTHLAGCPACQEEYESLSALVASTQGEELDA